MVCRFAARECAHASDPEVQDNNCSYRWRERETATATLGDREIETAGDPGERKRENKGWVGRVSAGGGAESKDLLARVHDGRCPLRLLAGLRARASGRKQTAAHDWRHPISATLGFDQVEHGLENVADLPGPAHDTTHITRGKQTSRKNMSFVHSKSFSMPDRMAVFVKQAVPHARTTHCQPIPIPRSQGDKRQGKEGTCPTRTMRHPAFSMVHSRLPHP